MFPALHSARRLAASLALGFVVFSNLASIVPAQAATILAPTATVSSGAIAETATPDQNQTLLAHHEGSVGATQLLTAGASATGAPLTKSLWGNMILSMALQQDSEVRRISKKLGRVSGFVFTSVGLISALSLAQGIDGLVTLQEDPHPYHPPILGLIGSSLSVLSVGAQAAMGHHYKKQLLAREDALAHDVEHILGHLKTDGVTDHVTDELTSLIGDEAAQEFIQLWNSVHQKN